MNMKPHPWWISVVYTVFLAPGHEQIHQQEHRWYYISRATGAVQLAFFFPMLVYMEDRRSGAAPRKTKRYCLISHLLFITGDGWNWRTSGDSNNTTTCSFVTADVTNTRSFLNRYCNISFWNADISLTAALCKSALKVFIACFWVLRPVFRCHGVLLNRSIYTTQEERGLCKNNSDQPVIDQRFINIYITVWGKSQIWLVRRYTRFLL